MNFVGCSPELSPGNLPNGATTQICTGLKKQRQILINISMYLQRQQGWAHQLSPQGAAFLCEY